MGVSADDPAPDQRLLMARTDRIAHVAGKALEAELRGDKHAARLELSRLDASGLTRLALAFNYLGVDAYKIANNGSDRR